MTTIIPYFEALLWNIYMGGLLGHDDVTEFPDAVIYVGQLFRGPRGGELEPLLVPSGRTHDFVCNYQVNPGVKPDG